MVVRVRCLFSLSLSLSHSLSSPCLSPPPLPSLCNNLLQPANGGRDKLSAAVAGTAILSYPFSFYRIIYHQRSRSLLHSAKRPGATALGRPVPLDLSLSLSFSPRTSIAEIRISTIYRDPLFLPLSRRRTVFHRLSSAEMEISLPRRGSCIPRASNRSIYRSLKNFSSFRDARLDKYSSGSR